MVFRFIGSPYQLSVYLVLKALLATFAEAIRWRSSGMLVKVLTEGVWKLSGFMCH